MAKLDVRDRKLLYYLSLNCRMGQTQLSKKIGLSKNAVKYRIERLQKEGIITKFASVINLGALKLDTVTLLLRFNEDIYEKKEIIDYFRHHPFANWVVSLSGQWDIFAEFVIKDLSHFDEILSGIVKQFSGALNTYEVFFSTHILRVEHLIEDFYSDLKLEQPIQKERTRQRFSIDEIDQKILKVLNEDSSLPYLQIAQKIGSTIDVVRYRMKNLVRKGGIIKFFSEVSLQKLGYTQYLYRIRLKNTSHEQMENIKRRISKDKNISYAFLDMTGLNIIFSCAFKDPSGIDHLSRHLRKEYSNMIEEQDYLLIKEEVLFNLFPRGLVASSDDVVSHVN